MAFAGQAYQAAVAAGGHRHEFDLGQGLRQDTPLRLAGGVQREDDDIYARRRTFNNLDRVQGAEQSGKDLLVDKRFVGDPNARHVAPQIRSNDKSRGPHLWLALQSAAQIGGSINPCCNANATAARRE